MSVTGRATASKEAVPLLERRCRVSAQSQSWERQNCVTGPGSRAFSLRAKNRFVCLDRLSLRYSLCKAKPSGKLHDLSPYRVILTRLEPVAPSRLSTPCLVMNSDVLKNAESPVHSALRLSLFINRRSVRPASFSLAFHHSPSPSFLPPPSFLRGVAQRARPLSNLCCAPGLFRNRNTNLFALRLILGFSPRMNSCVTADSKLCAVRPHHAAANFLTEIATAQLGKGQGFAPPRCIPSCVPQAAAETMPVSAPSARCAVAAFRSWMVRP